MQTEAVIQNSFKETEIGLLPKDWGVKSISEAFDFSKKPRSLDLSKFKSIPFIPMELISEDEKIVKKYELRKKIGSGTYVNKNDLIVAKITPSFENGKQGIVRDIAFDFVYATTEVWPIHEKEKESDIDYLYYYLKKPDIRNEIAGKMEGSTGRQRVPKNVLEDLRIPFPDFLEQEKISTLLDKIHEGIAQQNEIIKVTKELKKSLMNRLFTYGLRGEELKETEIGLMPESWEIRPITDIVEKTKQIDPKKKSNFNFKYIDVSGISNEHFRIMEHKIYTNSDAPSRARKLVQTDDVIFATVRPTLKRIAYIDETYDGEICSTAFCVLRSKKDILSSKYLYYCLQRDKFIEELAKLQRGASYPAITDSDVKRQNIFLPKIDEQKEIANILSSLDKKISQAESRKETLQSLFKTMLNQLMTGKVRVKNLDIEVN